MVNFYRQMPLAYALNYKQKKMNTKSLIVILLELVLKKRRFSQCIWWQMMFTYCFPEYCTYMYIYFHLSLSRHEQLSLSGKIDGIFKRALKDLQLNLLLYSPDLSKWMIWIPLLSVNSCCYSHPQRSFRIFYSIYMYVFAYKPWFKEK